MTPSIEEANLLIQWALSPENEDMKKNCCIMLANLSFPEEAVLGLKEKILEAGLMQSFLDYAASGILTLHREIDPNEIEGPELIAEGASAKVYK